LVFEMRVIILAAGEGLRLWPLTSTRPKHMLHISGRPVLEHLLLALKSVGITEITIIIGYLGYKIRQYFGDGSSLGLILSYVEQSAPLGTAHALGLAESYVDEDFMLVHGDLLVSKDVFLELLRRHEPGSVTMSVVSVPNPEQFGVVRLKEGNVEAIIEKPKETVEGSLVNAGIYIFPKDIFKHIKETTISQRREYEITDTLKILLQRGENIAACEIDSKDWLDIGRPWDLLEANKRVLSKAELKVEGIVESGAHLSGSVGVEKTAIIRAGAYIEGPALICEGSDIGPNCYIRPYTSIGRYVRVGNACEVKNSIVMDGSHIGHLSYVGDSIVGERCNLGAGTILANLRFDEHPINVSVKGQPVNSGLRKLGAFVGDEAKTGVGVLVMPGIIIGSKAWVGPGVVLKHDLGDGMFVKLNQELEYVSFKSLY
jgi:bifunctional UDP-N-acetylglucosamine pyrophosphorylase/glucosamine-1-phosphate N-acetyltransferase